MKVKWHTHRENTHSDKTQVLMKSINKGIWVIATLNQLFIIGSLLKSNFQKKKHLMAKHSALWKVHFVLSIIFILKSNFDWQFRIDMWRFLSQYFQLQNVAPVFHKKVFAFQEPCSKVVVMKTSQIFQLLPYKHVSIS